MTTIRLMVDAVFDGVQWDAPSNFVRRRPHHDALVRTDDAPRVGEFHEGERIDDRADSIEALRMAQENEFGNVWLVVGRLA